MAGGREATYVYLQLIWVDVWQKPTQYCNYPSIKNKERKIKRKGNNIKKMSATMEDTFYTINIVPEVSTAGRVWLTQLTS